MPEGILPTTHLQALQLPPMTAALDLQLSQKTISAELALNKDLETRVNKMQTFISFVRFSEELQPFCENTISKYQQREPRLILETTGPPAPWTSSKAGMPHLDLPGPVWSCSRSCPASLRSSLCKPLVLFPSP